MMRSRSDPIGGGGWSVSTTTVRPLTRVRVWSAACAVGRIGAYSQACPRRRVHSCACVGEDASAGISTRARGGVPASTCWAIVVGATWCHLLRGFATPEIWLKP